MRGGLINDWHSQGLYLIAYVALLAGVAHHFGCDIICGLMLGMMLMVYTIMLARVHAERR